MLEFQPDRLNVRKELFISQVSQESKNNMRLLKGVSVVVLSELSQNSPKSLLQIVCSPIFSIHDSFFT